MTIPYWVVYCALVATVFFISIFLPEGGFAADLKLVDPAKASFDIVAELNKSIGTLATTMLAASVALVVKGKDWSLHWSRLDGCLLIVVFVAGAVAHYGIYVANVASLEMVATGVVDPLATRLQVAIAFQYYALLGGMFVLGLVFCRMLETRRTEATPAAGPSLGKTR